MVVNAGQETFRLNPSLFLEKAIKEYVTTSRDNRLPSFGDEPIFDEPLVGFADGDDPIFREYKAIIGDFHLTPREALESHQRDKGVKIESPPRVGVISWVLPFTYKNRASLRPESVVPSLRWNHSRWQGQEFINKLAAHLASIIEGLGYQAVAPESAGYYKVWDTPNGRISNWSHRHMAYAAGLGTFSLNDGFITPRGIAMRCGSAVTDIALSPSPRTYQNRLANCLFYQGQSCRRCIERCPAGAITEQGHDKKKCSDFIRIRQPTILKELHREEGYIGQYLGCALCQVKVPCEDRLPVSK